MQNTKYEYSSVHIDVPTLLANDIILWGKENVTDEEIFVAQQDPSFGREDEIHATILYGLQDENPDQVINILSKEKPIKAKLGATRIFSNPLKFDVVVIHVISKDLRRLNQKLSENVKYTNRYGTYNPHVTIAYVKKGKGWQHAGCEKWSGKEFVCDLAVFSSKNGKKHSFHIGQ